MNYGNQSLRGNFWRKLFSKIRKIQIRGLIKKEINLINHNKIPLKLINYKKLQNDRMIKLQKQKNKKITKLQKLQNKKMIE